MLHLTRAKLVFVVASLTGISDRSTILEPFKREGAITIVVAMDLGMDVRHLAVF